MSESNDRLEAPDGRASEERFTAWAIPRIRVLLGPALAVRAWFTVVFAAVVAPAGGWMLSQIVGSTGDLALTNTELLEFLVSFRGGLFLLLATALTLGMLQAELACMLVLAADASDGRRISAVDAIRRKLVCFPRLLRLGALQGLALMMLGAAALGGAALLLRPLLGAHDINYYLAERPPEFLAAAALAGLWVAGWGLAGLAVFSRWAFSVSRVVFGDAGAWAATVSSWVGVRGRMKRVFLGLGGWVLGVAGAAWLSGLLLILVCRWVGRLEDWGVEARLAGTGFALALGVVVQTFWLLAGFSGLALLMVRLDPDAGTFRVRSGRSGTGSREGGGHGRHRLGFLLLAGGLALAGIGGLTASLARIRLDAPPAVTAHRGSAGVAPENTLAALKAAIEDGADYAEIDVQSTADGSVVLLHDGDLMRVGKDPRRVGAMTLAEVRGLDVGGWFSEDFRGERVPTLGEVIDLVGGRMRLNVELKYNVPDPDLAERVVGILRERGFVGNTLVTSLEAGPLRELRTRHPDVRTGLIVFRSAGRLADLEVDALSLNASQVDAARVDELQARGKEVHVWTVNTRSAALRMIEAGVDNIITDHPAMVRAVRDEWEALSVPEKILLRLRHVVEGGRDDRDKSGEGERGSPQAGEM